MLNRKVLVLNKHWVAVHVCTVRRALMLVYQEMARIVAEDFDTYTFESWRELSQLKAGKHPMIHTPSFQLLLPRVIVLSRYHRCPPRTVKFNRRNIFIRDGYTCQYCGVKPREDDLTIDHVIPRSRGGFTTWDNVVLACVRCNTKKGNRLASECGMSPLKAPNKPAWINTLHPPLDHSDRSFWEKFVDLAYWETRLHE